MPIDNEIYNREGGTWRDENHFLSLLRSLTPPRVDYIRQVLTERLQRDPTRMCLLDVGCGGGLMAEEVAQWGCTVTGADPSESSLAAAYAHAETVGLDIEYRTGAAESLPFVDASFDLVYCCDVLEHVADVEAAITEASRVLVPGGIYIYDTINRTNLSKLVLIKLAQEWEATRIMPPNFHDWNMFIKPPELATLLTRHGLDSCEIAGFALESNPVATLRAMRNRRRGKASYGDVGSTIDIRIQRGKSTAVSYAGYALKRS